MSFYLGLSLLSNKASPSGRDLHAEGRRILGLLDRGSSGIIETEPGGRPRFTDGRADFSVSHSAAVAAVSFSAKQGAGQVLRTGCDVQRMDDPRRRAGTRTAVGARFFHPPEQEYIAAGAADAEKAVRFYYLWALKECFLKMYGRSVFDMAQTPVFLLGRDPPAYRAEGGPETPPVTFYLYELEHARYGRYALAVSREFPPAVPPCGGPGVYWFSGEKLPLKTIAEINAAVSPVNTVSPKT
jgi:hypothetical protein